MCIRIVGGASNLRWASVTTVGTCVPSWTIKIGYPGLTVMLTLQCGKGIGESPLLKLFF